MGFGNPSKELASEGDNPFWAIRDADEADITVLRIPQTPPMENPAEPVLGHILNRNNLELVEVSTTVDETKGISNLDIMDVVLAYEKYFDCKDTHELRKIQLDNFLAVYDHRHKILVKSIIDSETLLRSMGKKIDSITDPTVWAPIVEYGLAFNPHGVFSNVKSMKRSLAEIEDMRKKVIMHYSEK